MGAIQGLGDLWTEIQGDRNWIKSGVEYALIFLSLSKRQAKKSIWSFEIFHFINRHKIKRDNIQIGDQFIKTMLAQIGKIQFPIGVSSLHESQKILLEGLHKNIHSKQNLISQAKLSLRMASIIFNYFFSMLYIQQARRDSLSKFVEHKNFTTDIAFLCHDKIKRDRLVQVAKKSVQFVAKNKNMIKQGKPFYHQQKEDIKNQFIQPSQVTIDINIIKNSSQSHFMFKQRKKTKQILITTAEYFLNQSLKEKQKYFTRKLHEYDFQIKSNYQNWQCLSCNRIFIETNCLEDMMEKMFKTEISQTFLRRAFIQQKKLDKYYHFKPSLQQKRQNNSIKIDYLKQQQNKAMSNQDESLFENKLVSSTSFQKNASTYNELNRRISSSKNIQSMNWNIGQVNNRFSQLYHQSKEALRTKNGNLYDANNQKKIMNFSDCYFLLNLQIIGYVISFLLVDWRQNKNQFLKQSLHDFIFKKVCPKLKITKQMIRKMRRILLAMLYKFPPKINRNNQTQNLSCEYIGIVCQFLEKLIIWHEIFNCDNPDSFFIIKEKIQEKYTVKVKIFDQNILFKMLRQKSNQFFIYQKMMLRQQYFRQTFRFPEKTYNLHIENRQNIKSCLHGFIVSSTPYEQDLKIKYRRDTAEQFIEMDTKNQQIEHYKQIIRAYGVLIHDICEYVPDGVVAYFPTLDIMRECSNQWKKKEKIYEKIMENKTIFQESQFKQENEQSYKQFCKNIQIGQGSIFFVSAQSQFGRRQTFSSYQSRSIIMIGMPFNESYEETNLKREVLGLKENYRFQEALKNVVRCLSNCVDNQLDLKIVVFAGIQYNRIQVKNKWFPFIAQGNLNTLQVLEIITRIQKNSSILLSKKMSFERGEKEDEKSQKVWYENQILYHQE